MMEVSPLANIDRLSSRSTFRGFTGSPCGIIGTCVLIAVTVWMNLWIAISYSQGNYFQSSFETQASSFQTLQVPYDLKMVIVFYDKTSGAVANHSLLNTYFDTKMFTSNYLGSNTNIEAATLCNSSHLNYFADAVNPVTLTDCFLFTPNKAFLYAYVVGGTAPLSQVGFSFAFSCFNSFFCRSGGSTLVGVQSNMIAAFTNYSMTFIFSTRVLQPDGSTKHQVYNISSGQFVNPSAPAASFDAQLMLCNTTMDYSIMPWRNIKSTSNLGFFGLQRATPKSGVAIYTPFPRISAIASNYQYQIYRYYKKEDWLLGVIGGSAFLNYICLWIICHLLNQSLFRMNAAQELLLEAEETDQPIPQALKRPKISWSYLITRFFPWSNNKTMDTLAEVMDITTIIKKLKVAKRNVVHFVGAENISSRQRHLEFGIELPTRHGLQEHQQSQRPPQVQQRSQRQQSQHSQGQPRRPQSPKRDQPIVNQSSEKLVGQQMNQIYPGNVGEFDSNFQAFKSQIPQQKIELKPQGNESLKQIPEQKLDQHIKLQDQLRISRAKSQKSIIKKEVESKEKSVSNHGSNNPDYKKGAVGQAQRGSQSNAIFLMRDQQQVRPQANNNLIAEDSDQCLGLHPEVLQGIKYSSNTQQLLGNYQTAMYIINNPERYNTLHQIQQYSSHDGAQKLAPKTKCKSFLAAFAYYFKFLDFFNVKIQFNAHSANHSWLGVFFTMIIIALPCLQLANFLQLTGTYEVHISKDFLQPSEIKYTLTTGKGFRPAVCGSFNFAYYLTYTVQLQYFTYTPAAGYTYYNSINLPSNSHSLLGITPDSIHSSIYTENCFVMPDNVKIPMGGYNTDQEAFFGFRITGYCSGTNAYCASVQSSTNAALFSFMNSASNTPTLYTPINQYSSTANSVLTGQVYAHVLREGTSNFNMNMSIQETLYLDRIQLIDSYSARFVGNHTILEDTISTSRYQLGEVTKSVNTTIPYYEVRLRPSGMMTRVYLAGYTLDVILGMIGGIFFLAYIVFHCFGKIYNSFNVRAKLANVLFDQQAYNCSTMHKLSFLFAKPFLNLFSCNQQHKYMNKRLQKIDDKMKQYLNAIEMVKQVDAISKLSTIPYRKQEQKMIASIYLKERADVVLKEEPPKDRGDAPIDDVDYQEDEEDENQGGNQIINEDNLPRQQSELNSKNKFDWIDIEMQLKDDKNVDHIKETEPYRHQGNIQKSKISQYLSWFDIFHSDAEFALNGQWRVRSIFGAILFLLSIVIFLCIFVYFISNFTNGMDKRISSNKGMLTDPNNSPPLSLNTSQNFRVAFGFYLKPNFAFTNMSSFNINGPNSTLGASVYQYTQVWINNAIATTQTKYDLIPCPTNYFDGFMSPNDDPTYYSSVANGFCLPNNVTLRLTPEIQNNYQYFRVSVYNKTAAANASLLSLTSAYALGLYITIPIVNLKGNGFSSKVHQLRPNSQGLTRAYNVNVTLTQQSITFTTPRYKADDDSTTVNTYSYLENRAYQITNTNSATSLARVYNVTFAYSGLVETYTVSYSSIAELFGYAGGILLVVLISLGCIAQSFNSFYRDYLIGKELYLLWPSENKEKQGKKVKEEKVALLDKVERGRIERINDIDEFAVFRAWLLSFPANVVKSYDWNDTLQRVQMIRGRALSDLDLYNFYEELARLKDTINSSEEYRKRLSEKEDIPLASIFDKQVVAKDRHDYDYDRSRPFYKNVVVHQLSSRDQWILFQYGGKVKLEEVFDEKYLENVLVYKVDTYDFQEDQLPIEQLQEVMVREEVSSSISRKGPQGEAKPSVIPPRQESEAPQGERNEVEEDSRQPLQGSAFQYHIQGGSDQYQSNA